MILSIPAHIIASPSNIWALLPVPWPKIERNNIEGGFEGIGNVDRDPGFRKDTIKGTARSVEFDPSQFSSTILIQKAIKNTDLSGRVLLIGNRWSVVKSVEKKTITVWGDLSAVDRNVQFEILSEYRIDH